jgi:hypothetical protein
MIKYLYRFDASCYGDTMELILNKYPVFKSTPCGYWIYKSTYCNYAEPTPELFTCLRKLNRLRWVSASTKKAYAYTKTDAAIVSYYHRKRAYVRILTSQLENAKRSLNLTVQLPVLTFTDYGFTAGKPGGTITSTRRTPHELNTAANLYEGEHTPSQAK